MADAQQRERLAAELEGLPVQFGLAPSNDVWVRDHGPIGVQTPAGLRLLKFRFDGWGGKYPAALDDRVVWHLAEQGLLAPWGDPVEPGFTLEGGAIEGDGAGTLLATRRSIVDEARNPDLDADTLGAKLRDALGLKRVLWLEHGGLAGDDTDGHIDTLARFASPEAIVYQGCQDPALPNHAALSRMAEELRALRRADGQAYTLYALPHTEKAHGDAQAPLPTSYANALLLNGRVLVPQYGDPSDAAALQVWQQARPQDAVEGVDCRRLVQQYGGLHCATMNIPAPAAAGEPALNLDAATASERP